MQKLRIMRASNGGYTRIENAFLDKYLKTASGDQFKVYLYIMRHFSDSEPDFTMDVGKAADELRVDSLEIYQAIQFWSSKEELSCDVVMPEKPGIKEIRPKAGETFDDIFGNEKPIEASSDVDPEEDFQDMVNTISVYLGIPVMPRDMFMFLSNCKYFYGFETELIEYMAEICRDNNIEKPLPYMRSIANTWVEKKITTMEQAKKYESVRNVIYKILKGFGLSGRNPVESDMTYVERWVNTYGMSEEMMLDAVRRTMTEKGKLDFKYCDGILRRWHEKGISTPDAAAQSDKEHAEKKVSRSAQKPKKPKGSFYQFEQRNYDYGGLEKTLLTEGTVPTEPSVDKADLSREVLELEAQLLNMDDI